MFPDDIMYRYESDGGKYTIATSYWNDGGIGYEFTFDNLLRRIDGEPCEYDAEGHLTSCGEYTFVWEGGNIVRVEGGYSGTVEYTYYTDRENKSPVYPDPLAETFEDFFIQASPATAWYVVQESGEDLHVQLRRRNRHLGIHAGLGRLCVERQADGPRLLFL